MATDLNDLVRADTARIEFTHPVTGASTGWFITLYGPGSEEHEAAAERMRKRRLQLIRRHKREEDIPNDVTYSLWCEFLADVTAKLEGMTKGGVAIESSRKAALDLFSDKKHYGPEFAAQAATVLGDLSAFSKA